MSMWRGQVSLIPHESEKYAVNEGKFPRACVHPALFPGWLIALTLLAQAGVSAAAELPSKTPSPTPKASAPQAPMPSAPAAPPAAGPGAVRGVVPGPGVALSNLRLVSLTPAGGEVPGLTAGPMASGNSVEARLAYTLSGAESAQIAVFSSGVGANPPHTAALGPVSVTRGSGEARLRFAVQCGPGAPATIPISTLRYRLVELAPGGRVGRTFVEKTQPVNLVFRCGATPAGLAADDVRIVNLSPASGELDSLTGGGYATGNSIEATVAFSLSSIERAHIRVLTAMEPGNGLHTGIIAPTVINRGSGETRVQFSIGCAPESPAVVPIARLRYALMAAGTGEKRRTLVEKHQPVNFSFRCPPHRRGSAPAGSAAAPAGSGARLPLIDLRCRGGLRAGGAGAPYAPPGGTLTFVRGEHCARNDRHPNACLFAMEICEISNRGGTYTGATFRFESRMFLDGRYIANHNLSGVLPAAGQTHPVPVSFFVPLTLLTPGEHTVRVSLDTGDFMRETDEGNNNVELKLLVR